MRRARPAPPADVAEERGVERHDAVGNVWVDPISRGLPPSQLNVAAVRFFPGARSAWHSHDGGQTLSITEGAPHWGRHVSVDEYGGQPTA